MRSLATCCVLLLFLIAANAQQVSPNPKPNPDQRSSPPAPKAVKAIGKPSPISRGSDDSPVVVKLQNTGKSKADDAEDRGRFDMTTSIDWRTMAFTGGLLLVAILQLYVFFKQLRMMKSTSETGTAAAQSAAKNAAAVQAATEPYLFPEVTRFYRDQAPGGLRPMAIYGIRNYGKTPAILTHFSDVMIFTDRLPDDPGFLEAADRRPERNFVIGPESVGVDLIVCRLDLVLPVEELTAREGDGWKYYLVGTFRYEDFAGTVHTKGFCLQLIAYTNGAYQAATAGGKRYNYRTKSGDHS